MCVIFQSVVFQTPIFFATLSVIVTASIFSRPVGSTALAHSHTQFNKKN